uniref:Methyltransferase domain-containing protein n=1 Tax=Rhizochromulina marina TaxID=1034831 RepID=A0A7S2WE88_9STRA|mmetsp:Transcript_22159/g.64335  ORF Transcript_22159/g.64335 Transcript_22159/m.64335 type:complete len:266 (+) Transcript_22159:39-836(+)
MRAAVVAGLWCCLFAARVPGRALSVRHSTPAGTKIGGLDVRRVEVPLPPPRGDIWVYEVSDFGWWEEQEAEDNPYGCKLWPGAVAAARFLSSSSGLDALGLTSLGRQPRVLELGCGNGLCSLAAARAGMQVTATDISTQALELTAAAVQGQSLDSLCTVSEFDIGGDEALPEADLVLCADLLYDETLAAYTARRVWEAAMRGSSVLVGGDPRRAARQVFLHELAQLGVDLVFESSSAVALPAIGWKAKAVEVGILPLLERGAQCK